MGYIVQLIWLQIEQHDKDEDGQGTRKEGDDEMKKTEANDSNRGRKQLQQSMWTVDGIQFLNQQKNSTATNEGRDIKGSWKNMTIKQKIKKGKASVRIRLVGN